MKKTSPRPAPLPPTPHPAGVPEVGKCNLWGHSASHVKEGVLARKRPEGTQLDELITALLKMRNLSPVAVSEVSFGDVRRSFPGGEAYTPVRKGSTPQPPPHLIPGGGRASGGGRGRTSFSHEGVVAPPDSLLKWGTLSPPASPSRPPARGVGGRGVLFLFFCRGWSGGPPGLPGKTFAHVPR